MKKQRIHKRTGARIQFRAGIAAPIACMKSTIDAYVTSWAWKDVTCLPCLRKRPSD